MFPMSHVAGFVVYTSENITVVKAGSLTHPQPKFTPAPPQSLPPAGASSLGNCGPASFLLRSVCVHRKSYSRTLRQPSLSLLLSASFTLCKPVFHPCWLLSSDTVTAGYTDTHTHTTTTTTTTTTQSSSQLAHGAVVEAFLPRLRISQGS